MANALTTQMIEEKRKLAETKIREHEQRIAHWRGVLADAEAGARLLSMFGADGESKPADTHASAVTSKIPPAFSGLSSFSVRNPFRTGTNKAYMWEALDRAQKPWLNANEIQEEASRLKGETIPMASVSPMLSEMKGQYLERDGLVVALKSRLNENGEAETSPDAGESANSS